MGGEIAEMQSEVLRVAAESGGFGFALAGGTALERYYLHHRFSRDLDFFSTAFDPARAEAFMRRAGIGSAAPWRRSRSSSRTADPG